MFKSTIFKINIIFEIFLKKPREVTLAQSGQWIAIGQSASRLGCILPIAYWLAWHPNRAISKWLQSARRLHFLNQTSVSISFMEAKSELIRWSQSALKVLQDSMRSTLAQHFPPIECSCRLASPSSDCKGAPTTAHWKALPTTKSGGWLLRSADWPIVSGCRLG